MNRNVLLSIVAVSIAVVLAIVLPVAIVSAHSTERLKTCVESGGAYVHVSERTTMECQR